MGKQKKTRRVPLRKRIPKVPEGIPAQAVEALRKLGTLVPGPERDVLLGAVNRWEFVNVP